MVTIICTLHTCKPHLPSSFIMQVACVESVDNEINKSFLRMRWLIVRYQHTLLHLFHSFKNLCTYFKRAITEKGLPHFIEYAFLTPLHCFITSFNGISEVRCTWKTCESVLWNLKEEYVMWCAGIHQLR